MIDQTKLREIYKRYGFVEKKSGEKGISVYTLRAGHYHNADIVVLNEGADEERVFSNFKETGYACKTRRYQDVDHVEKALFKGFFSVDSTKNRLLKEYEKFTKKIASVYADDANYEYIKSSYFVDGHVGESDVITEVVDRLDEEKPILFLIEAAAGYGKTCTAYELLNALVSNKFLTVPLFSELSRNRQAKIFRYVLLDEIDRSFPLLSSSLVRAEIRNGNVPVVLDGFDELLHSSNSTNGYDNAEPMLETIGELLQDKAKVILTTRRTAIFDGDEFHEWMENHNDDFKVIRIRIDKPTVADWLTPLRHKELREAKFAIESLSNPVLLSYLRFISDDDFAGAIKFPDKIVDKYFEAMLGRESIRQDLRMSSEEQYSILKSLAKNMLEDNFTSEDREYVMSIFSENHHALLEKIRKNYPVEERPTLDELLNKLASHALLDRLSESTQGIGFVNEFVLGSFCADVILADRTCEWAGDQRFIEPTVLSYIPRSKVRKNTLWQSLRFSLEFSEINLKIQSSIRLLGRIGFVLSGQTVENISLSNIELAKKYNLNDTIFINCLFSNVKFYPENIKSTTFANSEFYDCEVVGSSFSSDVEILGSNSNNAKFLEKFSAKRNEVEPAKRKAYTSAEIYILEKFWPIGRASYNKHRPIKGLCVKNHKFSHHELIEAIRKLKKKEILLSPDKVSFLELNVDKISKVKKALSRG